MTVRARYGGRQSSAKEPRSAPISRGLGGGSGSFSLVREAENDSRSSADSTACASAIRPRLSSQRGDSGSWRRNHQVNSAPVPPSTITQRQPSSRKWVGTKRRDSIAATGTAENPAT